MNNEIENDKGGFSLKDFVRILRINLVMIIIVTILFTCCGGVYAFLFKKTRYTAEARVQIYIDPASYSELSENQERLAAYSRFQFSSYIVNMAVEIMKSSDMMNKVKDKLEEKDLLINGSFGFETTEQNPSFSVKYEMKSKADKKDECKAVLDNYLQAIIDIIKEAEDEATEYTTDASGNRVKTVKATKYGWLKSSMICVYSDANVSVNKGTGLTIVISFLAGFVIAFIIAFILYVCDDTVKTKEQVEELTGSGVIAFIEYTDLTDGEEN